MTPVLTGVVPCTNGVGTLDVVLSLLGSVDRRGILLSIPLLFSIEALGMVTSLFLSVDRRAPLDGCGIPRSLLMGSPLLVTRDSNDFTAAVLDVFLQTRNISLSMMKSSNVCCYYTAASRKLKRLDLRSLRLVLHDSAQ